LVMTGRVGWQKNYKSALRLMRYLPHDITLSMCGHGTDSPSFLDLVKRLAGPAAGRVRCLGPLPAPDIRAVLESADGYMLSSRYEGLPIGALEACESGLPLILGDFEGAEQLLSGLPIGLCLSGETPKRQAQKIDIMLQNYLSNRAILSAEIKAHWAKNWAPDVFDEQARDLVSGWLNEGWTGN
jgi:glycosyltransferase involved in cell wall biosynthesis